MTTIEAAFEKWLETEDGKSVVPLGDNRGTSRRRDAWVAFHAGVDAGREIEREEIGKRILRNVLQ